MNLALHPCLNLEYVYRVIFLCCRQVLEVICGVKNLDLSEASDVVHKNTLELFKLCDK